MSGGGGGTGKLAPQRKPAQNPFAVPVGSRLGNLARPVAAPARPRASRPAPLLYDQVGANGRSVGPKPARWQVASRNSAMAQADLREAKSRFAQVYRPTAVAQFRGAQRAIKLDDYRKSPVGQLEAQLPFDISTKDGQRKFSKLFQSRPLPAVKAIVGAAQTSADYPLSQLILRENWKRLVGAGGYRSLGDKYTPERGGIAAGYTAQLDSATPAGYENAAQAFQMMAGVTGTPVGKGIQKAAHWVAKQSPYAQSRTGTGPPLIATAMGPNAKTLGGVTENALANALRFPAQSVGATVETVRQVAGKAGEGKFGDAAMVLPNMVGDSYKQFAENPRDFAYNSPLDAGLMVAAPFAAGGRLLGGAMRAAPIEATRRAASTKRSPIEVSPGLFEPRHYSKNILVKGAQVLSDAPRKNPGKPMSNPGQVPIREGNPLSRPLDRTSRELRKLGSEYGDATEVLRREAMPRVADEIRDAAPFGKSPRRRRKDQVDGETPKDSVEATAAKAEPFSPDNVDFLSDSQIARDFDEQSASVAQALKEAEVKTSPKGGATEKVWKPGRSIKKAVGDILAEGIQGIIRPSTDVKPGRFRDDLRKRLDVLKSEQGGLRGAELRKSKELSDPLERVLALGNQRLAAVEREFFRASEDIGRRGVEFDDVLVERGAGLEPEQALRRRLAPYAQAHMGADFDSATGTLTTGGGTLSPEAIMKRMVEDGLDPNAVSYINTRAWTGGSANFRATFRVGNRPSVGRGKFTGSTLRRGTYESKFENIVEQFAKHSGIVEIIKRYDQMIREFGLRKDGASGPQKMQAEEAKSLARSISVSTAENPAIAAKYGNIEWVAVKAHSAVRGESMDKAIAEYQGVDGKAVSPAEYDNLMSDWQRDLYAEPKGNEASVLMPKPIADTIRAQGALKSNLGWSVSNAFRRTVLALHATWIAGNVIEAFGVRLPVSGVHPGHYRTAKKVLAETKLMDEELHREILARTTGGTQGGLALRTTRKTALGVWAHGGSTGAKVVTPLTAIVDLANLVTTNVFKGNKVIEQQGQTAAFGKYLQREAQELTGSWLKSQKLTEDVVKQLAEGFYDQGKVVEAARYVDSVLGKYGKFSPELRQVVSSATPFLPWALNAVRFFAWTLPVKHPVQATLVVSMERALAEHFKEMASEHPGSLRHEIPVDGGVRQLARYTPAGLFIGSGDDSNYLPSIGDTATDTQGISNKLAENAARQFLPQYMSILDALRGLNWKGKPATSASGENIDRVAFALTTMVNAWVPFVSMAQQYREGGGTPYDDSNVFYPKVKPGTRKDGTLAAFADKQNPFRVIKTGSTSSAPGLNVGGLKAGGINVGGFQASGRR